MLSWSDVDKEVAKTHYHSSMLIIEKKTMMMAILLLVNLKVYVALNKTKVETKYVINLRR